MPVGLLVSLGGTIDPVVHAIQTHQPGYVCFVVSEASRAGLTTIESALASPLPEHEVVVCNDSEDLVACYAASVGALRQLESRGYAPSDIVVDYTGGDKKHERRSCIGYRLVRMSLFLCWRECPYQKRIGNC